MNFPAIHNPGSIEALLEKISTTGIPDFVDKAYLAGIGFARDVDIKLLDLLAFLGLTDKDSYPTDTWSRFTESGDYALLLGKTVLAAYDILFEEHSDAADFESKELMIYFTDHSEATGQEAAYMTLTFKVLCDLADFPADELPEDIPEQEVPQETSESTQEEISEEEVAAPEQAVEEALEQIVSMQTEKEVTPQPRKKKLKLSLCIDIDDDLEDYPDLKAKLLELISEKLNDELD